MLMIICQRIFNMQVKYCHEVTINYKKLMESRFFFETTATVGPTVTIREKVEKYFSSVKVNVVHVHQGGGERRHIGKTKDLSMKLLVLPLILHCSKEKWRGQTVFLSLFRNSDKSREQQKKKDVRRESERAISYWFGGS